MNGLRQKRGLFLIGWVDSVRNPWVSGGENVVQSPLTLSVQEGNSCDMNCSYSDSASNYFPWYKQEAGTGPRLIIYIHSNQDKTEDGRFTVSLNKAAKQLSLHIKATQPGDSAVYFCAASAHCFSGTCNLYANLRVEPPLSFGMTFNHR
uniref:Ig-like domain-containing protein n=1 Tax=Rhinolophus ferrumequinum TaxID=59479 RepID=A0A671FXF3_RHIFE